jgi:hypothetical protein
MIGWTISSIAAAFHALSTSDVIYWLQVRSASVRQGHAPRRCDGACPPPQVQASLVLLVGWAGWSWSAVMRRRERLRVASSIHPPFLSQAAKVRALVHATPPPAAPPSLGRSRPPPSPAPTMQADAWPGVSVVMPVKGCRQHSLASWRSVLASQYGETGPPPPPKHKTRLIPPVARSIPKRPTDCIHAPTPLPPPQTVPSNIYSCWTARPTQQPPP